MACRSFNVYIVLLLGAALTLSWFSEDLKQYLTERIVSNKVTSTSALAQVMTLKGAPQVRGAQSSLMRNLEKNEQVRHLDRVFTDDLSQLELRFKSDHLIHITPGTEITLELWNPQDPKSPVYIHILSGSLKVQEVGSRGQLYILNKGRLISADLLNLHQVYRVPKESDNPSEDLPESLDNSLDSDPPLHPQPVSTSPTSDSKTTLSNAYIDQQINKQSHLLRKCQTNSLRKQVPAIGEMLVGFQIKPSGRIEDARVIQSDITNEELSQCVLSVFRRVRLKPFNGLPILRTFPILFK